MREGCGHRQRFSFGVQMMLKNKYRIVRDNYLGYEVQIRRWWFPIWLECQFSNTHISIEKAEAYAENYENNGVIKEFYL